MSTEAAAILDQTVEAPVTTQNTETKPPESQDRVSPKFELLVKRESSLRQQTEALRAKEAEITQAMERIKEFESAKGNSKKALELLGLNYDELTQSLLKDGEIPPEVKLREFETKLETMERERLAEKEREAQDQKRMQEANESKAITDFKSEINQYVSDNAARYEYIKFEEQEELVFDVIDEHYKRTMDQETGIGKVMNIAEAADKVEKHLEEKDLARKKLSKAQALWGSLPQGLAKQLTKPEVNKSQPPKTLTNNLTASTSKIPVRPPEDQRIAGIVNAFRASKGF